MVGVVVEMVVLDRKDLMAVMQVRFQGVEEAEWVLQVQDLTVVLE
jgi:hypothetical protein